MDWETRVRRTGAALIVVGLLTLLAGLALLAYDTLTDGPDGATVAPRLAVGGLVLALVGSMALLVAPDTLPPGEREP